jgi:hypothetical protein
VLTSEGQAETLARAYLYFGDLEMADEFVRRLRSVDLSTVAEGVALIRHTDLSDSRHIKNLWCANSVPTQPNSPNLSQTQQEKLIA